MTVKCQPSQVKIRLWTPALKMNSCRSGRSTSEKPNCHLSISIPRNPVQPPWQLRARAGAASSVNWQGSVKVNRWHTTDPGFAAADPSGYFGFTKGMRPNFEYFLSCGIPGEMEGERYIRTPEMVREVMKKMQNIPAEGKYIIFKRWDKLEEPDEPEGVIFFATPDVLSGLFTLANFDQVDGDGVIAPFGSGCSSIVYRTYLENAKVNPRAVLGMFDCSARPCVPKDTLSFSIPMKKFITILDNMDESFLITETWETVKKRIN